MRHADSPSVPSVSSASVLYVNLFTAVLWATMLALKHISSTKRSWWNSLCYASCIPLWFVGMYALDLHGIYPWGWMIYVSVELVHWNIFATNSNEFAMRDRPGLSPMFERSSVIVYLALEIISVGLILSRDRVVASDYVWDTINCSLVTAWGVQGAHYLVHQRNRQPWSAAADLMMSLLLEGQYCLDHLHHHRHENTVKDSACATFGTPFYWFFMRRMVLSHSHAREVDRSRWVQIMIVQCTVVGMIALSLGQGALIVFVAQSIMSNVQVETLNYIWHYGYDRTGIVAWDAQYLSFMSWNTQVHIDHHNNPSKELSELVLSDDPDLFFPFPFLIMVVIAQIPPLFFHVMNPLVESVVAKKELKDSLTPDVCNTVSRKKE